MFNVAYREIYYLVDHGFSPEYLERIPIALRRHFFKLYKAEKEAESTQRAQQQSKHIKFDPIKPGQ